ncbi:MAG: response regulator transcription factor [Bdellovibrionales bacterium]|nr:response regulator transcription factor [Bdellovibrionales bacterium]
MVASSSSDSRTPRLVFVVEDNPELQLYLSQILKRCDYSVLCFSSAEEVIEHFTNSPNIQPLAVLIDFHLAGKMNGHELVRHLRDQSKTSGLALILLTAQTDKSSIVDGLKNGADDYITKPFETEVLVARLEACLRRVQSHPTPAKALREKISGGGIEIDPVSHEVRCGGRAVALTAFEFQLLGALMSHPNEVLSREDILIRIVGAKHLVTERTIDVHIRALRSKLGQHSRTIETIRGFGYKFNSDSTDA